MHITVYAKRFHKDVRRCERRGKNMDKFKILARTLLSGEPLDAIHRDHNLVENGRILLELPVSHWAGIRVVKPPTKNKRESRTRVGALELMLQHTRGRIRSAA